MIKSVKDLKAYEDVFTLIDECTDNYVFVYDLENDLYLKKICPDSRNKLVYCDNDICYYDCFDGDYLCIATKDAIKMKENCVHNNSGLIRLNELNSNEINIDYEGKRRITKLWQ